MYGSKIKTNGSKLATSSQVRDQMRHGMQIRRCTDSFRKVAKDRTLNRLYFTTLKELARKHDDDIYVKAQLKDQTATTNLMTAKNRWYAKHASEIVMGIKIKAAGEDRENGVHGGDEDEDMTAETIDAAFAQIGAEQPDAKRVQSE